MFKVRLGTSASGDFEYDFFVYFASCLKKKFEEAGIDGYLIGYPECKDNPNLQIDALLVTDSNFMIIEFKQHCSCEIYVPREKDFFTGQWKARATTSDVKEFPIRGGASPNPCTQVRFQRWKLWEVLKHSFGGSELFDFSRIVSVVCFSERAEIKGVIPSKHSDWFRIVDQRDFVEQIFRFANERGGELLNSNFVKGGLINEIFIAEPYDCKDCNLNGECNFVEQDNFKSESEVGNSIVDFLNSKEDVLILKSTDSESRERAALMARDCAHNIGFLEAKILTSNKISGIYLCSNIDADGSVYREIYDFSKKEYDEKSVIEVIPLKEMPVYVDDLGLDDTELDNKPTVFIIAEGHLINDFDINRKPQKFGSGNIINDITEYLQLGSSSSARNKLIVIGDDCQLEDSKGKSAFNKDVFLGNLGITEMFVTSKLKNGPIDALAEQMSEGIRHSDFSLLRVWDENENNQIVALKDRSNDSEILEDAVKNWRTHKILTYERSDAKVFNERVKHEILKNGQQLQVGDLLVADETIEAPRFPLKAEGTATDWIYTGQFLVVKKVNEPCDVQGFNVLKTVVALGGSDRCCTVNILLDYLNSEKGEYNEELEKKIFRCNKEAEEKKKPPFLKARYGWALNAHKARKYRWDEVTIFKDAHMSRHCENYFRFIYTCVTRANKKVNFIDWVDVSPFEDTEFAIEEGKDGKDRKVLLQEHDMEHTTSVIEDMLKKSLPSEITFEHEKSSNYLERFRIAKDDDNVVVSFYTNKKTNIFAPEKDSGSEELFRIIDKSISNHCKLTTDLDFAFEYLMSVANCELKIEVYDVKKNEIRILVSIEDKKFFANVWHSNNKKVTKFKFWAGDLDAFKKVQTMIERIVQKKEEK